jgi:hypothetical protein
MREVPISCGVLPFFAVGGRVVALAKCSCYFVSVVNGSYALVILRRDKDATWRSLGTLCREQDWSRPRLIYELQNGLPYRSIPPGRAIDWHDPDVVRGLDVEASEATITHGVLAVGGVLGLDRPTVGIEVLPPEDAEMPSPPADEPIAAAASADWAFNTVRDLRDAGKIPAEAMESKAALSRFLAAKSQKAVTAGKLRRALKASYIENWLEPWGIWPLSASK